MSKKYNGKYCPEGIYEWYHPIRSNWDDTEKMTEEVNAVVNKMLARPELYVWVGDLDWFIDQNLIPIAGKCGGDKAKFGWGPLDISNCAYIKFSIKANETSLMGFATGFIDSEKPLDQPEEMGVEIWEIKDPVINATIVGVELVDLDGDVTALPEMVARSTEWAMQVQREGIKVDRYEGGIAYLTSAEC